MELGKNQKRWIEALRSGKYKKGMGYLNEENDTYSCLDVAREIFEKELTPKVVFDKHADYTVYGDGCGVTRRMIQYHLGLRFKDGDSADPNVPALYTVNDHVYGDDTDFNRAADYIEKQAEAYFDKAV